MDVWTAIRTKRMVRDFLERPLQAEHLTRIVDAGRHAGSSKNQQRWDFIVIEDRETLRRLAQVGPYAGHLAGAAAAVASAATSSRSATPPTPTTSPGHRGPAAAAHSTRSSAAIAGSDSTVTGSGAGAPTSR